MTHAHLAAEAAVQTPVWLQFAVSALGGGVVGSLTSTLIASNREGRTARAHVRDLISTCENLRWGDIDYKEFKRALSELESAALIAQIPPMVISRYAYIAEVARATNLSTQPKFPDHPQALPIELHMLLNHTVLVATAPLWRRWYRRPNWKLAVWQIDEPTMRMRNEHPDWAWTYPMMKPLRLRKEPGLTPWALRLCPPLYRKLVTRKSDKRRARIMQSEGLS